MLSKIPNNIHDHLFQLHPYLSAMFLATFALFMAFSALRMASQQLLTPLSTHALKTERERVELNSKITNSRVNLDNKVA